MSIILAMCNVYQKMIVSVGEKRSAGRESRNFLEIFIINITWPTY